MTNTVPAGGIEKWFSIQPVLPESGSAEREVGGNTEREWEKIIDRLLILRGYRDDWDGEGSHAPGEELVDSAIQLVQEFREKGELPPVGAACTDDGCVVVEWSLPEGSRTLEVNSPRSAILIWIPAGKDQAVQTRYIRTI